MTPIESEILSANGAYASSFGDKGKLAMPPARHFAILTCIRGLSNDIYFQIGLVTLIGLAAKNAILIVEFAKHRHEAGMSPKEAAIEAAKLRFRPIIMTSMAFILGVVPLVLATGAGAASRQSIGTGVFGGMLAATFLAIFFVPLFFVLVRKFSRRGASHAPVDGIGAERAITPQSSAEGEH